MDRFIPTYNGQCESSSTALDDARWEIFQLWPIVLITDDVIVYPRSMESLGELKSNKSILFCLLFLCITAKKKFNNKLPNAKK